MDWKLFATTFAAIFLAELGDKTQLATLSLSAGGSSRWVVFAGSALALVATSAIAVLVGDALTRVVPPIWIRRTAGALFVVLGVVFLLSGGGGDAGESATPDSASSATSAAPPSGGPGAPAAT
ncbi:TMEM165/GDT1 family protein [Haliangium ochraceum]|uniref:GDT1 family protein n=1 Tax=Haliangium ochraceum (strain DSM 14365 / JCM 11303 / SMP-2) TaxID=502025 RepID=D0LW19_HALO1|nr:TMEM165/GDT1 family protein [Haliangium ochraceum]ACY15951.1 protein of unknown function UPF0016 [Haliangium ochraceum DSM 14365]